MSDKKISALTGATTPLAGSEVLPIVQSGVTKKVSVDNLTAGKDVSMKSFSTTDSSGVGIAPRAWVSGYKGLDFNAGSLQGGTDTQFMALQNIYRATDASWRYTHDGAGLRVLYEAGNIYWDSVPSGLTGAVATLTTRMTLDGSNGNLTLTTGNLVIGTTAKGVTTGSSIPLGFGTNNNTAAMTLLTTGSFVIGGTASQANGTLTVAPNDSVGAAQMTWNRATSASASTAVVFRNANTLVGAITYSDLSTAYGTTSDYRLKENVTPMAGALAKVTQLKPVTYTWKSNKKAGQGFIAHELQAVVPECVIGEKDAKDEKGNPLYQSIDTSFLVATLVAAIQELKAEVDALKAKG